MPVKMSIFLSLSLVLLSACASVRQSDLDSWVGLPVVALDTQSFFLTLPVIRTMTDTGVEIRDYVNKRNVAGCMQAGFGNASVPVGTVSLVSFNSYLQCSGGQVGCDNIFYIRGGKVVEYRPTGNCYTDDSVRPQSGWEKFQ